MIDRQTLDGALGAHGHERRQLHSSVRRANTPRRAAHGSILTQQLEGERCYAGHQSPRNLRFSLRQLLADFVQAGDAEVLALQQVVARLANQFADGGQTQANHALAGPHGQIQIRNRSLQHGLFVGRQVRRVDRPFRLGLCPWQTCPTPALGPQHVADFDQRRLAEVLAGQQLLLGGARQVAERVDAHLLQAVATADRQFKVGDGDIQHLIAAARSASELLRRSTYRPTPTASLRNSRARSLSG